MNDLLMGGRMGLVSVTVMCHVNMILSSTKWNVSICEIHVNMR